MAEITRTINAKRLKGALVDLRMEGYKAPPPKPSRAEVDAFLSIDLALGADPSHPSLALFKAMASGPSELALALADCSADLIDKPMIVAAREAGAKEKGDTSSYFSQTSQFTPLQFCARFDLWREARLLLAHGANPSLFNAEVTATGMAAYCGSARVFAELFAFGCDLRLYLKPEHAPGSSSAAGSTLLHRIANRSINSAAQLACARVMARDESSYPDLMSPTLTGQTVLDWADTDGNDAFKTIILQAIASREAQALKPATPKATSQKRSASL